MKMLGGDRPALQPVVPVGMVDIRRAGLDAMFDRIADEPIPGSRGIAPCRVEGGEPS